MAGLAGIQAGNAAAVSRNALIERLRETAASGIYQWEVARRDRVAEELDRTRHEIAAHRPFGDLPATIELRPGELHITFSGAEDMAAKLELVELSQAMAHDWIGFT